MKFCQHCGKELLDQAVLCPGCGCLVEKVNDVKPMDDVDLSVNIRWVVLAVLVPLFGFIYWPVNAKSRPRCAMACGIAAIVSWALGFVFMIYNLYVM